MKPLILSALIFAFSYSAGATQLSAEGDLELQFVSSGKNMSLSRGQKERVSINEPIWVRSPDKIPMLLIPINDRSQVTLNPQPLQAGICDTSSPEVRPKVEAEMSSFLLEVFELQKHISNNNTAEAQLLFNKLEASYPKLAALEFLGASLDILKGKREDAAQRLKRGLEKHPDYKTGRNLSNALQGRGNTQ